MMDWNDEKYSRRSSLPPVPEEDDDDEFIPTRIPLRRASLFGSSGFGGAGNTAANRRSWHGEITQNDPMQSYGQNWNKAVDWNKDGYSQESCDDGVYAAEGLRRNYWKRISIFLSVLALLVTAAVLIVWSYNYSEKDEGAIYVDSDGDAYCSCKCKYLHFIETTRDYAKSKDEFERGVAEYFQ